MKPGAYDGKARDARIVDAWLTRMTTYLKLTKTPEGDKVELASSYLESDAYDWFIGNQTTLLAGTFDVFKASFRDHFVPQNHKIAVYNEYKRLKQNGLSVSEYSIKIKALADQIPDFVPTATRDLDFVTGLFDDIRRSLVSQPPVPGETWNALVGRALRVEETLRSGYQRTPNRLNSTFSGPRRDPPQSQSPRSDRLSNSARSSNWRQKPTNSPVSSPIKRLEPLTDIEKEFLRKHEGCFRCRRTYAGHTQFDPECPQNGGTAKIIVKNSELPKEIKQEVNFVNEAEYEFEDSEHYQVVPPIVLPIQLDDQITTEGLVDCGSTSDFISQKLVNDNPTTLRPRLTSSPSLLHNALSKKPVRVSEELIARIQFQSPVKVKTKSPTVLKVAPLISHDVILGMPFLEKNNLLVDPVARTVIPRTTEPVVRKLSLPIADQNHYVKVGNALMQVPETTVRTLCRQTANMNRAPPTVITHRYTVRLACCAIAMEDVHYKELNSAFTK